MPVRIDASSVSIVKNEGKTAEITDNLILWELLSKGQTLAKGATKTLSFTAKIISATSVASGKVTHALPIAQVRASAAPDKRGFIVRLNNMPAGGIAISVIDASGKKLYAKNVMSSGAERQSCLLPVKAGRGVNFLVVQHMKITLKEKIATVE